MLNDFLMFWLGASCAMMMALWAEVPGRERLIAHLPWWRLVGAVLFALLAWPVFLVFIRLSGERAAEDLANDDFESDFDEDIDADFEDD